MKGIERSSPLQPEGDQPVVERELSGEVLGPSTRLTEMDRESKTIVGNPVEHEMTGAESVIGENVGKYQIRALLGQGGMGAVYLAYDPLIEREVALKVLTQDVNESSTALKRFLGEARAIGRLNHPHVISIYDIDQWNGRYYIVMELLSGGSVADLSDRKGAMPWQDACDIVAQAARGLEAAHAAGMIHRDIKPENLMLTKEGLVKVVDFGLSKLLETSDDSHEAVTKAGQILGTPQYMSPEQFEAEEIDARTDVYSLGATLFRLLTARFPYHDCRSILQVMTAHLTKPPPVPADFVLNIPPECDQIIARAMAKSPADRYQTSADMAAELQALIDGKASGAILIDDDAEEQLDRPLSTVVIVEPSKLQGAVLKDSLLRMGAKSIQVVSTVQAATREIQQGSPDLLITAMQLPDGVGIDLLRDLCGRSLLEQTVVVLNSSDSTIQELVASGPAACLILAPKTIKADDMLRIVHAAGPCIVQSGPLAAAIDPLSLKLRIVSNADRIPEALAGIIRELQLLDVEVVSPANASASTGAPPDLTLMLHTAGAAGNDQLQYAALVSQPLSGSELTAAVQVDGGSISLRAVSRQGAISVCRRGLDAVRLVCLLQSCRT